MTLDSDPTITKLSDPPFYIDVYTCQVQLPLDLTAHTDYKFEILPHYDPIVLDVSTGSLGSCGFTYSLTIDGQSQSIVSDQIVIERNDFELAGTYEYVYQMEQTLYNEDLAAPFTETFSF